MQLKPCSVECKVAWYHSIIHPETIEKGHMFRHAQAQKKIKMAQTHVSGIPVKFIYLLLKCTM